MACVLSGIMPAYKCSGRVLWPQMEWTNPVSKRSCHYVASSVNRVLLSHNIVQVLFIPQLEFKACCRKVPIRYVYSCAALVGQDSTSQAYNFASQGNELMQIEHALSTLPRHRRALPHCCPWEKMCLHCSTLQCHANVHTFRLSNKKHCRLCCRIHTCSESPCAGPSGPDNLPLARI